MKNFLTIVVMSVFMLISNVVHADVISQLNTYIKNNCDRGCVDSKTLYAALSELVNPKLKTIMVSIIKHESNFIIKAKNRSSKGLTQINIRWHKKRLQGRDVYDPFVNIKLGYSVLDDCYKKSKGNVNKALTCYRGKGSTKYVKSILKELPKLKFLEQHPVQVVKNEHIQEVDLYQQLLDYYQSHFNQGDQTWL